MDRKCVLDWLNRVYITPSLSYSEYTDEEIRIFAHDALVLLTEHERKDRMFHALEDDWKRLKELRKEHEAVEPFHKCTGNEYTLIEDSHFDYCPYCGKPITWEGR